jgi:hypothetical protein
MGLLTAPHARRTARAAACALGTLAACTAPTALALDYSIDVDLRARLTDATPSFLSGGLGKFRDGESGLGLGRLRIALDQRFGEHLHAHIDASSWGDADRNPIDLTEAWLEWRSLPRDGWRVKARGGFFFPPSSVENRAQGWESPYTISFAPMNAWLAEEIRIAGVETTVEHLGIAAGGNHDVGVYAGAYGWNDPAGIVISEHGFALHDRQTTQFGRIGQSAAGFVARERPFEEIDGRAGWYAGLRWRYRDRAELRALHYDNRADPARYAPTLDEYGWLTRFDTAGLRWEAADDTTLLLEGLQGETSVAPDNVWFTWDFHTVSALFAKRRGPHQLALRFDDFHERLRANLYGPATPVDDGHAWTLAWSYAAEGSRWRFMLEGTRVTSSLPDRAFLGENPLQRESKLELSVRYLLEGTLGPR